MREFVRETVQQRVEERYALMEIQGFISVLRQVVLNLAHETYAQDTDARIGTIAMFEDLAHRTREWAFEIYLDTYEERVERQRRVLAELSTPVIQVYENVLVLPLVGAIDTERARRVMEELLLGITHFQAELVIIDITGVPVVDTSVANHLIQTIKAARLLGARSILVGISSEIAQTLVHLRVDLSGVETRSNLQAGIEFALAQMGLEIAPLIEDLTLEPAQETAET
ncbi:MAG: STAS domain-containing protein [Chloroflexia bacterium]|nr:STAS domain-containing protein [Chloroflexia bacterium]